MLWMSKKKRARLFDAERLKQAIADAERLTSGEIVVSVSPTFLGSIENAAERAFERLHVSQTKEHNGVLFFVVPGRKQFMVLGDEGIHDKVGQEFWDKIAAAVSVKFKAGDMTGGICDGIAEVGRQLAIHFPHRTDDTNELPDDPEVR